MYVVVINVPCTDDMLSFETSEDAKDWIMAHGPWEPGEYAWGHVVPAAEVRTPWSRLENKD